MCVKRSARRRALAALRSYPILGIRTNVALLVELLEHPRFIAGSIDTGFLDKEGDAIRERLRLETPSSVEAVAAAARKAGPPGPAGATDRSAGPSGRSGTTDPWTSLRDARV
jgi:acetyl/propionyl-CoA carboxylase alpha subunit